VGTEPTALIVATYMALGHHVPTFLRAYADPDEYRRNRRRLIVIPLLVVPVVFLIDARLATLIFVWDQFHFVRQNYGMMRIYDAKLGVVSRVDANLDQWLNFAAFVAIIFHSNFYSYLYAGALYDLGIVFPSWTIDLLRRGSLVVVTCVAVVYLANLVSRSGHGEPVSLLKLVLFATTFSVWYFAYCIVDHALLSYAISSFFHCWQYDAFAWYYNHSKAGKLVPTSENAFFRFIHDGRNLWLYLVAILSYGAISQVARDVTPELIIGANLATGVLHYYFDSFIWRVRRADFRENL
jgi:hypothetical protein